MIVEPRTRKIVTVVHRGGSSARAGSSTQRISLTQDRRKTIKQTLIKTNSSRPSQSSVRLTVGSEVPQSYEIREFPTEIIQEAPELREYDYIVEDDNVIVVDRRERRVIEIID